MITDKIKLSYIAGIIDGEGHVSIYRNKAKTCTRGYRHRVIIAVTNTDLKLMNLLKSWFGGHVASQQRSENWNKAIYGWRIWAVNEQLSFLKLIKPYLFLKNRQAEICIDFLENGAMGFKGLPVTDQEWQRRENLCKKIQYINRRYTRLAAETKWEGEDESFLSDSPDRSEK